jgi:hypothetical protein
MDADDPARNNTTEAAPAEASELKPGAQVIMSATQLADEGDHSASRVTLVRPGAQLPY